MTTANPFEHCPAHLSPDEVVNRNEPSLSLAEDETRAYLRERMNADQLRTEIDAICELAEKRSAFGIYGLLGLIPVHQAYTCIYSGDSPLNWMHEHERKRLGQLKSALPTFGEEAEAARERLKARIAARFGRRQAAVASDTARTQHCLGLSTGAALLVTPAATMCASVQLQMQI